MKSYQFILSLFLPVFVCNAQFKTDIHTPGYEDFTSGKLNPTTLKTNLNTLFRPVEAIYFQNDSVRSTYSYYPDGFLKSDIRAVLINNNWQEKYQYNYSYSNGYLSEIILRVYTNNNWSDAYRWNYYNDLNGNHLMELVEHWSQNSWYSFVKITSTYDQENHKLTDSVYNLVNGNWVARFIELNTYENSLLKTQIVINTEQASTGRSTYIYDGQLRLAFIFYDALIDNNWVLTGRETFTYNGNILLSKLLENWEDPEWVNYRRITYEHNNLELINITIERWTGFWSYEEKTDYVYDDFGNAVLGEHFLWQEQWIPFGSNITIFYSGAEKIEFLFCSWVEVTYTDLTNAEDSDYNLPGFNLSDNYPNPFNPSTNISYNLAKESKVRILLHNILGEEIRVIKDEIETAGEYSTRIVAEILPAGVYFYTLIAEPLDGTRVFRATKKMSLVK